MALRNIVKKGDPVLRKKSRAVTKFDARLQQLIDDMLETLANANGAGLAAVQVGVLRRVVIIHVGEEPIVMINPEIFEYSGEQESLEGCLSIPGEWGITRRPMHVKARYQNRNGEMCEIEGTELLAKCICHELDHLEGVLYVDNVLRMVDPDEIEYEDDSDEE